MNEIMKEFQQGLIEVEMEAENLLLARHQVIKFEQLLFLERIIFIFISAFS